MKDMNYFLKDCLIVFKNKIFNKDALNCPKVKVNAFIMLQKISISNKSCSFEFSIHQIILKNKMFSLFPQKQAAQLLSTLIIFSIIEQKICIL